MAAHRGLEVSDLADGVLGKDHAGGLVGNRLYYLPACKRNGTAIWPGLVVLQRELVLSPGTKGTEVQQSPNYCC